MSSTLLSKAAANDAAASPTTLERVTIPISGMTCAACQSFIQRTLVNEAGVQDASVNLMLHNATVTFDTSMTSFAGSGGEDTRYRLRRGDPGARSIHFG